MTELIQIAIQAALEAGKVVMEIYKTGGFRTSLKKDASPVTTADRRANSIITAYLARTRLPVLSEEAEAIPFAERRSWEYFWLVDPLDGTKEFINRHGGFTINIALVYQTTPVTGVVYAPGSDAMYWGSPEAGVYKYHNGIRSHIAPRSNRTRFGELKQKELLKIAVSGSHMTPETKEFIHQLKKFTVVSLGSSLKFMLLLENAADIYPRLGKTMEWDTAAAHAILNAANRGVYHEDLQSELSYNKPDLVNPPFIAF